MTERNEDFEKFFFKNQSEQLERKVLGVKRKQFSKKVPESVNKLPKNNPPIITVVHNCIERKKFSSQLPEAANKFPTNVETNDAPVIAEVSPQPPEDILKTLLKNQNKILQNQEQIRERIENLEKQMKENVVDNSVTMAQNHTTRECKVILEKMFKSITRLTGEEENELQIEIGATLPLSSIDGVHDVEEKLEKPEYREAMKTYLFQLKGGKGTVQASA